MIAAHVKGRLEPERNAGGDVYTQVRPSIADPQIENETHRKVLAEFRKEVGKRQPRLTVETGLMAARSGCSAANGRPDAAQFGGAKPRKACGRRRMSWTRSGDTSPAPSPRKVRASTSPPKRRSIASTI